MKKLTDLEVKALLEDYNNMALDKIIESLQKDVMDFESDSQEYLDTLKQGGK